MANITILLKYALIGVKISSTIFLSLLLTALVNVLLMTTPKLDRPICQNTDDDFIPANQERLSRFSKALQLKTLSYKPHEYEKDIILEFHDFLEKSFPVIHSSPQVTYEKINKFSLLYTVNGTDADSQPYILAGASSDE